MDSTNTQTIDSNMTTSIPSFAAIPSFGASPFVVVANDSAAISLPLMAAATSIPNGAVIPLSNAQQVIFLKLSNTNFIYWRTHILYVYSFVDDSFSCPPSHITSADMSMFIFNSLVLS